MPVQEVSTVCFLEYTSRESPQYPGFLLWTSHCSLLWPPARGTTIFSRLSVSLNCRHQLPGFMVYNSQVTISLMSNRNGPRAHPAQDLQASRSALNPFSLLHFWMLKSELSPEITQGCPQQRKEILSSLSALPKIILRASLWLSRLYTMHSLSLQNPSIYL